MAGGPLADRHGRVVVIDLCLGVMILLTFANLLMTGFWAFRRGARFDEPGCWFDVGRVGWAHSRHVAAGKPW